MGIPLIIVGLLLLIYISYGSWALWKTLQKCQPIPGQNIPEMVKNHLHRGHPLILTVKCPECANWITLLPDHHGLIQCNRCKQKHHPSRTCLDQLTAMRRELNQQLQKEEKEWAKLAEQKRKEEERQRQERVKRQQEQERLEQERKARQEAERRASEERCRQEQEKLQRQWATIRPEVEKEWAGFEKMIVCHAARHFYPRFLKRICPYCGSGELQEEVEPASGFTLTGYLEIARDRLFNPSNPTPARPQFLKKPPPGASPNAKILQELNDKMAHHQYDTVNIANLLLEILLMPSQQYGPGLEVRSLGNKVSSMVTNRYGIPESVGYRQPLRDEQLPPEFRRSWEGYEFHQLMIFAFLLGATWRTLPAPHDKLVPYYELMAQKQHKILVEMGRNLEKNGAAKVEKERLARMEAEITALREQGKRENLDVELIEAEVAHIREQYTSRRK